MVPSSFHSGMLSLNSYLSNTLNACCAAASAYTIASISEFDARRLPPCKPVHEHSPIAYRRRILDCPFKSTFIPPHK